MKFHVFLRIASSSATTAVRLLLLVVELLLRTMVRDGVLDRTLDVGINWLERSNVLQLGEVQRWVFVRRYGPDGHEPAVARVAILPVASVARTAAADDIQQEDEHAERGAYGDGRVERVKVPVDVPFEVRIVEIGGALIYR